MKQTVQRGCGISITGDLRTLAENGLLSARGQDQIIFGGAFLPLLCGDFFFVMSGLLT